MKPQVKLATTLTPDGGEMELYHHDRDFSIKINGLELMNSRQHESERELARLGCAHLIGRAAPCVLVGGLGMGYTLRQALDMLPSKASIVVSELLPAVVDWNRQYLGQLNDQPLDDERTELITGDIVELLSKSIGRFDAILLDVDNGPSAMTDSGNQRLYGPTGIIACRRALRPRGSLAIWSTKPSKTFEQLLIGCGLEVRRYRSKAYQSSKSTPLFIWVSAEDESLLPPGGDEPSLSSRKKPKASQKRPPGKQQ